MNQLLEILLDIWLMTKYLIAGFIILMLLQLICYQVFKFNIIKTIENKIINKFLRRDDK